MNRATYIRLLRLLVLLTAVALQLSHLAATPPGLTHDEADHGLSAWQVVEGARPIYFTVGLGREPLYDYATAGLMGLLGPTFFAQRLTSVFFSLLLLAGTFPLVRRLFAQHPQREALALLAVAALATNFWALMVARHALRTITLPAIFLFATIFWLRSWENSPRRWWWVFWAGLLLGLTFYTYFAARLLWLLWPGLLLWWLLRDREQLRHITRPTLAALAVAGLVAAPLFIFLWQNPNAEIRIGQLTGPLDSLRQGDWQPLLATVWEGLQIVFVRGDGAWRYNLPERPLLNLTLAPFFLIGLGQTLRSLVTRPRWATPPLLLGWLLLGWLPALLTGAELSTTRAIGLLPVLFILCGWGMVTAWGWVTHSPARNRLALSMAVLFFAIQAAFTAQAYFGTWGNHPQVRLQYETLTIESIATLDRLGPKLAVLSNPTPDRFHAPPLGLLTQRNREVTLRWIDGRQGLLLPASNGGDVTLVSSAAAPVPDGLVRYLDLAQPIETLTLRPDDIQRQAELFQIEREAQIASWNGRYTPLEPLNFGDALTLFGVALHTPNPQPGDVVEIVTFWEAQAPIPPQSDFDETVLFTQLLGADGLPLAQADSLAVPADQWVSGDIILQLHQFTLPPETPAGRYSLISGVYNVRRLRIDAAPALERLTTPSGTDFVVLGELTVGEEN